MRLLLDTNVLIWAMEDNPRLGAVTRGLLADRGNDVLFSIVSVWEVLIKLRIGKLHLDWRKLTATAAVAGFERIGVTVAHMEALADLPLHHRDPFDHLLIAQALAERAALVSQDAQAALYPVEVIGCR